MKKILYVLVGFLIAVLTVSCSDQCSSVEIIKDFSKINNNSEIKDSIHVFIDVSSPMKYFLNVENSCYSNIISKINTYLSAIYGENIPVFEFGNRVRRSRRHIIDYQDQKEKNNIYTDGSTRIDSVFDRIVNNPEIGLSLVITDAEP